jgi:dihydroxyacetone kinase-like protein
MTLTLDKDFFADTIAELAKMAEEQRNHLSHLDSEIGDGDHGVNLSIGFREVTKRTEEFLAETDDISSFLRKVGMALLGKVGGASGPLYGSLFMSMGDDVKGQETVTFDEFIGMIENGVAKIEERGKAELGDKTMIDALRPGVDFLKEQEDTDGREVEIFREAVKVMKEGSDKTIPLVAKKGRALRLGERAIGHRDPGSESSWMIMDEFLKQLEKRA